MKTSSRILTVTRLLWSIPECLDLGKTLFYSRASFLPGSMWAETRLKGVGASTVPVLLREAKGHSRPQSSYTERASLASSGHHSQTLGIPCTDAVPTLRAAKV